MGVAAMRSFEARGFEVIGMAKAIKARARRGAAEQPETRVLDMEGWPIYAKAQDTLGKTWQGLLVWRWHGRSAVEGKVWQFGLQGVEGIAWMPLSVATPQGAHAHAKKAITESLGNGIVSFEDHLGEAQLYAERVGPRPFKGLS
jgi:hypothetical protein